MGGREHYVHGERETKWWPGNNSCVIPKCLLWWYSVPWFTQIGMLDRIVLPLLHSAAMSVNEFDMVRKDPCYMLYTRRNKGLPALFTTLQTSTCWFVLWCSSRVSQSALEADEQRLRLTEISLRISQKEIWSGLTQSFWWLCKSLSPFKMMSSDTGWTGEFVLEGCALSPLNIIIDNNSS